jgi:hypothetical protein
MRIFRSGFHALLLMAGGGLLGVVVAMNAGWSGPGVTTARSLGPRVQEIQELSELVALRVQVADVLMAEHSHGAEMALLVRGDCDLTIDLAQAEVLARDETARQAVIRLPQPVAVRPRVDHERTRVFQIRRTGWWTWRDPREDLYAQGMEQAQQMVAHWGARPEQIEQARQHAARVLAAFYRELGWRVAVEWRSEEKEPDSPLIASS